MNRTINQLIHYCRGFDNGTIKQLIHYCRGFDNGTINQLYGSKISNSSRIFTFIKTYHD